MKVFITGATGWVGSAIVAELLGAGHEVTGLARSEEKASALAGAGAQVILGSMDDHQLLIRAASDADAVIHTAFDHDFSKFAENAAQDQRTIHSLGQALKGSGRPLLVTSGLSGFPPGKAVEETDLPHPDSIRKSEHAARAIAGEGVRVATIRLAPSVHGIGEHGFVSILIDLARRTGVSAYPGDGRHRWAAVHRRDAALLYRLVIEQGAAEPVYHAVADEGIRFKEIAEAIGNRLDLPVESRDEAHFGWFARFAAAEMFASSTRTRSIANWQPSRASLLADLDQPDYYVSR
jgi:nucleoside-diphosphate-sugar epimerase